MKYHYFENERFRFSTTCTSIKKTFRNHNLNVIEVFQGFFFLHENSFVFFFRISPGASNKVLYPFGRNENTSKCTLVLSSRCRRNYCLLFRFVQSVFVEQILLNLFFSSELHIANKRDNYNGSCLTGNLKIFAQIIEFSRYSTRQRAQNWMFAWIKLVDAFFLGVE